MGKLKNIAVGTAMAGASLAPVGEVKGQEQKVISETKTPSLNLKAGIDAKASAKIGRFDLSGGIGAHYMPFNTERYLDVSPATGNPEHVSSHKTPNSALSFGFGAGYDIIKDKLSINANLDMFRKSNYDNQNYTGRKTSMGIEYKLVSSRVRDINLQAKWFSEDHGMFDVGADGGNFFYRKGAEIGIGYERRIAKNLNATARVAYSHSFGQEAPGYAIGYPGELSGTVGFRYIIPTGKPELDLPDLFGGPKPKKVKRTRVKNPQIPCYSHQRKSHYRESGIFNHPNR